MNPSTVELNDNITAFQFPGEKITNYEMESSAIYGLAKLLNHKALTLCVVIGNRVTGEFLNDYKPAIKGLARKVLDGSAPEDLQHLFQDCPGSLSVTVEARDTAVSFPVVHEIVPCLRDLLTGSASASFTVPFLTSSTHSVSFRETMQGLEKKWLSF